MKKLNAKQLGAVIAVITAIVLITAFTIIKNVTGTEETASTTEGSAGNAAATPAVTAAASASSAGENTTEEATAEEGAASDEPYEAPSAPGEAKDTSTWEGIIPDGFPVAEGMEVSAVNESDARTSVTFTTTNPAEAVGFYKGQFGEEGANQDYYITASRPSPDGRGVIYEMVGPGMEDGGSVAVYPTGEVIIDISK